MARIAGDLQSDGIAFELARVKPRVLEILERSGALDEIGPQNLYMDVSAALDAYFATHVPATNR